MFLYPLAGAAVLVMAMIVLNSVGFIQLPFAGSSSSNTPAQAAKATPTPDFSGPESVRADRLFKSMAPVVTDLNKTLSSLNLHCYQTLVNSCYDSISATEPFVKNLVAVITNGDIPRCIAPQMAKVLIYVQAMDKQLQLALSGFQDNSTDELYTGVYRFFEYDQFAAQWLAAANQAKAHCYAIVLPTWVPA